jgi:hypothetical protein
MRKKLIALQKLTQISRDTELSRMRELAQQDNELKAQVQSLLHDDLGAVISGTEADRMIVAHEIRSHTVSAWKGKRVAELNAKRAHVRAQMEVQRKSASRAFGRDEALKEALKKPR